MKNEELNKIIEQLESGASKEKATFGIYYLEGEDEMHIKANKDGFELFASEMLKASRDSEYIIENSEKKYIDLDSYQWTLDGNNEIVMDVFFILSHKAMRHNLPGIGNEYLELLLAFVGGFEDGNQ